MSTMHSTSVTTDILPAERVPEPPGADEDRATWQRIDRGPRAPRSVAEVAAVVQVTLHGARKAWVEHLARRDGLTMEQAVVAAVDRARATGS